MKSEKAICVTKQSVIDLVRILVQTIVLLDKEYNRQDENGSVFEYDEAADIKDMIDEAKSEREIYKKVMTMMENKGHNTVCMMTSNINRKGTVKFVSEENV